MQNIYVCDLYSSYDLRPQSQLVAKMLRTKRFVSQFKFS